MSAERPLPRPDAIRAVAVRYRPLLDEVQAEIESASRDGSQVGHQEAWRGVERRLVRLLDAIEECAAAVEADRPDARSRIERLDGSIRSFEPDAAAIRGGRLTPLPTLPWADPDPAPPRRPSLRLIR